MRLPALARRAPFARVAIGLLALLGALGCSRAAAPAPPAPSSRVAAAARPYVVLVSFDAFRHDYLDRYRPAAFLRVAAAGVRAEALVPSFPSKTFPNHYSLVTGLYPGHHGIVGNAFYDPARGAWYRLGDSLAIRDGSWYGGEPIWATAERNGVRAATYFWPGSEAAVGGVRPTHWKRYDGKVPNETRVDEVARWLRLPAAERPHLVALYVSDVDDTTHRYGPDSPHTAGGVASADRALQRLLDSLAVVPERDSVNVVLVSDHGMAAVAPGHAVVVGDLLAGAGVDTARVRIGDNGPTMSLWFGGDTAAMRRAQAALAAGLVHASVYARGETPARWHVRRAARAGDLLLVADEGWVLARRSTDAAPTLGVHGYDPALPDMDGIFIAAGPNVRRVGTVAPFENVHVYPFVAALLGLKRVPRVDGDGAPLAPALVRPLRG